MQRVPSTNLNLKASSRHNNNITDLTLIGRSRANDGTSFVIPELKWMFDCGALVKPGMQPKHIFLSHTHPDHVSALPAAAFSSLSSSANKHIPTNIYLPSKGAPFVDTYLKSHKAMCEFSSSLDEENQDSGPQHYQLIPCNKGDSIEIGGNNKKSKYIVQIVECDHRIDCIGFSISYQHTKLKEEYQALAKKELSKLCREYKAKYGNLDDLMTTETKPIICFLGDTTETVFLRTHPELLEQHKIIIVECTYLDDTCCDAAKKYKHMHWDQLEEIVTSHPNTLFVLIHFSLRYSSLFIRNFFSSYCNVHPMLIEEEIIAEWNKMKKEPSSNQDDCTSHNDQVINNVPPVCSCFLCQNISQTQPDH